MAGKNKNKIVESEQQQQQQQSSGNIPPEKVSNYDDAGDDAEKNDQTNQSDTKTTTIDESLVSIFDSIDRSICTKTFYFRFVLFFFFHFLIKICKNNNNRPKLI